MCTARIAAGALVVLLLAGCGQSGGRTPRFVSPAASGTAIKGPATATAAATAAAGWPRGLVTTTYGRPQPFLSVSDPGTGQERLRVHLPKVKEHYWARTSFSADWSRLAWTTGKGPVTLHVAELRGTTYVETASWTLPGSKRGRSTAMSATFHGGTSRVWSGWFAGDSAARLFSVDARTPGARPRRERGQTLRLDSRGRPAAEKTVTVTGRPGWGGVLHRTAAEALYAVVQSVYTCDVRVTATVLACWGRGDYGAIATLTAHGTGGRVTMRKLAPASMGSPVDMVAAPDGRTLMFAVPKKGWYAAPVDGSASPQRRFARLGIGYALPVDWI
ncbi:hypothetical protein [Jidongwangia harbinensis]|uniref:hypothetical protein n=1 Tax=Jidongwangia harbinensis TaxID=2878561 RepID=UPI001CD9CFE7|nr:hypothetical protein [Jidongwangia harbinensis]MCA2216571.1 hypothetical protein [Jidongwangia harbinensis]